MDSSFNSGNSRSVGRNDVVVVVSLSLFIVAKVADAVMEVEVEFVFKVEFVVKADSARDFGQLTGMSGEAFRRILCCSSFDKFIYQAINLSLYLSHQAARAAYFSSAVGTSSFRLVVSELLFIALVASIVIK